MIDGEHAFYLIRKAKEGVCRARGNGIWHNNDDCSTLFQRKPWISDSGNHKHHKHENMRQSQALSIQGECANHKQ